VASPNARLKYLSSLNRSRLFKSACPAIHSEWQNKTVTVVVLQIEDLLVRYYYASRNIALRKSKHEENEIFDEATK
jgi:hypothetical protein